MRRRAVETAIAVVALAAGVWFFLSLGTLWPLARMDLVVDSAQLEQQARELLIGRGFDVDGYRAASAVTVQRP